MKSAFAALLLGTAVLSAQTAPQTPPPPAQPPMHHAEGGHPMGMHHDMMHMQDQVKQMRTTLEKMKANLNKITDPALRQQAQFDVDLWEQMVQHMEAMSKMMSGHSGMGMMQGEHESHDADHAAHPMN